MATRLIVQSNGVICEKRTAPGRTQWTGARDLRFRLEWLSDRGWWQFPGNVVDEGAARRMFREQRKRNRSIRWRLVAFNEIGAVALPAKWQGRD